MHFQYWTNWGPEYEKSARNAVQDVWISQYADDTSEDLTQPLPDPSNDDKELVLLGLTNKPRGEELEVFVSSPTVREVPLVYWKNNCGSVTN